jgi:serine/threonine protein kinase
MASSQPLDKKYLKEEEHEITPEGNKRYTICGMSFVTTKNYAVRKAVGQGAYGLVCSGRIVESGKLVAIKKIPKAFEDTVDCKRLLREIKILRHFKHDNVLGLHDILPPPTKTAKDWKDVYIVSELMDTDLHYIIHSKQPLTDEHFKYFLYQILRGVHAIHTAHVLHRDLKPGNLLVNKNCDLKICDFGLARAIDPTEEKKGAPPLLPPHALPRRRSRARAGRLRFADPTKLRSPLPCARLCTDLGLTEYVVTRWYRAPELLVENQSYTTAIDVWAVGCIFAEMLGRKALFPGRDYLHQVRTIQHALSPLARAARLPRRAAAAALHASRRAASCAVASGARRQLLAPRSAILVDLRAQLCATRLDVRALRSSSVAADH